MPPDAQALALVGFDPDLLDVIEASVAFSFVGIFDPDDRCTRFGLPRLGDDGDWERVRAARPGLRVALAVDPTRGRARLAPHYGLDNLVTLISPNAHVSADTAIGAGTVVQRGATISRYANLGLACKLNVDAAVHHDCAVGDFCTLAPGCRLLGSVRLGHRVYIGAGAIVLPGRTIGDDATIGAGAVVTHDIAPGTTVRGVPARVAS
jgi:sugar O-acyltransferase (sialic acid O-acetyltransferase NeuD family)